jgi:hypothetical protein
MYVCNVQINYFISSAMDYSGEKEFVNIIKI